MPSATSPALSHTAPQTAGPETGSPETAADRRRRVIGFALCIATILLAVLDTNIVTAATVPIVRDLDPVHGVDKVPWLIAGFQLAATAALPLYGKLCDVLGAKKIFVGAVAVFLLGSALCGLTQSMGELIAARALQGIGGGGLMSVTMVVLRQLAGPGDKGGSKGAGMGGIVAGGGMALGPWIGGLLSDHVGWRWIFYVNLPVGIAVLIAAVSTLRLPIRTSRHSIDFLGAGLAAAFSTTLLLVTQWGGKDYAWSSPAILSLITVSLAMLGLFLWRQATAAEPVLPLSMFRVRELRYGFAIQGLVGVAMMGTIIYVMIYLQLVRDLNSSAAGLYLIPMALGMGAVGLLSGKLVTAGWSQRNFVVGGAFSATAALALLATISTDSSLWEIRGAMLLMGIGFGQLVGQLIQLVQNAAPSSQLGVATTGVRFFQTLGGALGAAVFGTVLSRVYAAKGPGEGTTSAIPGLAGDARSQALNAFTSSMNVVFWCATGVMALAAALAFRLPSDRAETPAADAESERIPVR